MKTILSPKILSKIIEPEYSLFDPGDVDERIFLEILKKYELAPEKEVLVLPYGDFNRVGFETRCLYFYLACTQEGKLNRKAEILNIEENYKKLPITRIVSFGKCNARCPYCKRDCQFIDEFGKPIIAIPVPLKAIAHLGEGAVKRNEIIRFSGGDPITYSKETLALAEYFMVRHNVKVSIAHNGSGPKWVEKMLPYLSSAAIDLKGVPEKMGKIMGISERVGEMMYQLSFQTQKLISKNGILLDVRTPIFGDTSIEEMIRLGEIICKTNNLEYTFWTWRLYKLVKGIDWPVPTREKTIEMMLKVSEKYPDLWMGIRAKWEKGGMLYIREGRVINQTKDTTKEDVLEMGSGNKLEF